VLVLQRSQAIVERMLLVDRDGDGREPALEAVIAGLALPTGNERHVDIGSDQASGIDEGAHDLVVGYSVEFAIDQGSLALWPLPRAESNERERGCPSLLVGIDDKHTAHWTRVQCRP